jgi:cellulose synthase/poly-beta-1,6-N-acetylglucosamine synthase-like glycosyltransferase
MSAVLAAYVALLAYFAALHAWHWAATLLALPTLKRELGLRALQDLPRMYSGFEPPVSLLVFARDREGDIAAAVEALLHLDYPEYEVIVVNDGSDDATLPALQQAYQLEPFPEVYWRRLPTRPVRAIYHSRARRGLRVIDKERGGRADALNAGINASRYPLFCAVDDGAVLHPQGLRRLVAPFLDNPATVAAGGALRIANGSYVVDGKALETGLPPSLPARLQVLEQLRATFQCMGRAALNAELLLAGALTVFRKDIVVETGGHAAGVMDERGELVARLHKVLRSRGEPYAVRFVPETAGWITVPETFAQVEAPRVRAQYALAESIDRNRAPFGGGAAGLLSWPCMKVLEALGPLVEVGAFAFVFAMLVAGQLSGAQAALFVAAVFSLGLLSTAIAILVEHAWLRRYPRHGELGQLVAAAFAENLFYRPMLSVWRAAGTLAWIRARAAARRLQRRD